MKRSKLARVAAKKTVRRVMTFSVQDALNRKKFTAEERAEALKAALDSILGEDSDAAKVARDALRALLWPGGSDARKLKKAVAVLAGIETQTKTRQDQMLCVQRAIWWTSTDRSGEIHTRYSRRIHALNVQLKKDPGREDLRKQLRATEAEYKVALKDQAHEPPSRRQGLPNFNEHGMMRLGSALRSLAESHAGYGIGSEWQCQVCSRTLPASEESCPPRGERGKDGSHPPTGQGFVGLFARFSRREKALSAELLSLSDQIMRASVDVGVVTGRLAELAGVDHAANYTKPYESMPKGNSPSEAYEHGLEFKAKAAKKKRPGARRKSSKIG